MDVGKMGLYGLKDEWKSQQGIWKRETEGSKLRIRKER
jgi:hypothetical protein